MTRSASRRSKGLCEPALQQRARSLHAAQDGTRIAFQRGTFDRSANAYHGDLFVVDTLGRNERQLTRDAWSSQVPSWSPDGQRLAFHSDSMGRNQLYLLDIATGRTSALTTSTGEDNTPSYSPDGRFVAFTSTRDGPSDLYLYTALSTVD